VEQLKAGVREMKQQMAETKVEVDLLSKAVFGDPADLRARPGMVAEQVKTNAALAQQNEILTGFRKDFRKAAWMLVGLMLVGLMLGGAGWVLKMLLTKTFNL
jgi:hypothetical protein